MTIVGEGKDEDRTINTDSDNSISGKSAKISQWLHETSLRMEDAKEFRTLFFEAIDCIRSLGIDFHGLSFYLFEPESGPVAIHYTFHKGELSWTPDEVSEDMIEYQVCSTKEAKSWLDKQSVVTLCYLCLPTKTGTVTIVAERSTLFEPEEQDHLGVGFSALEMLVVRHRGLITNNPDLMALHDGRFDLLGDTADEIAGQVLQFITENLDLDRGGIFLQEGDVLRGFWGMDEQGVPEPITATVFSLYPAEDEYLTHAALIARGEEQFYLTEDLGAETGPEINSDYGANVAVPMRADGRIIGVLVADNFITKRPIDYDQVQPLMVLANLAAATLERNRLYQNLRLLNQELEQRVSDRTASLKQSNVQLEEEIVERRRVQGELQVLLEEKEMLYREIHHRVKNNLQTISSLLSLQADYLDDPRAVNAMDASRSRIEAMGRIHQYLYQAEAWVRVSFDQFIKGFVADLLGLYRADSVHLVVDCDPVEFDVDQSIYACMLINELIGNALKHAFAHNGQGTIWVRVQKEQEDRVMMEVADNGVGFPADLDFRQTGSLGLQVVVSLVQNLGGEIELKRENGTAFRIVFPPIRN